MRSIGMLTLLIVSIASAQSSPPYNAVLRPDGTLVFIQRAPITDPLDGQIVPVLILEGSVLDPHRYDVETQTAVLDAVAIEAQAAAAAAAQTDRAACAQWAQGRTWLEAGRTHAAAIISQATALESLTLSGTQAAQLLQVQATFRQLGTALRVSETDNDRAYTILLTAGRCVARESGGDPNAPSGP
jgi:hypothetical protein